MVVFGEMKENWSRALLSFDVLLQKGRKYSVREVPLGALRVGAGYSSYERQKLPHLKNIFRWLKML